MAESVDRVVTSVRQCRGSRAACWTCIQAPCHGSPLAAAGVSCSTWRRCQARRCCGGPPHRSVRPVPARRMRRSGSEVLLRATRRAASRGRWAFVREAPHVTPELDRAARVGQSRAPVLESRTERRGDGHASARRADARTNAPGSRGIRGGARAEPARRFDRCRGLEERGRTDRADGGRSAAEPAHPVHASRIPVQASSNPRHDARTHVQHACGEPLPGACGDQAIDGPRLKLSGDLCGGDDSALSARTCQQSTVVGRRSMHGPRDAVASSIGRGAGRSTGGATRRCGYR